MQSRTLHVIGILVVLLSACSPVQTPVFSTAVPSLVSSPTSLLQATSTSAPAPNLPPATPSTLVKVACVDASKGWGISADGDGMLLRTVDAGVTWFAATPPGITGLGYSSTLFALDAVHAWVLVSNPDFFTGTLYRTSDGGENWDSFAVPFGGGSLQFLDGNTGRMLADRGAGAGSQVVELFQSSDGGATWLSVFNDDPTRPDASGSLPFSGIKNGMTFLTPDIGWVSGTRPMNGDVFFYKTVDGGIDWENQSIGLPPGYEDYQYMPQAPVFFGQVGFLPLMIYLPDSVVLTFFVTHDGGETWSADPTLPASKTPPGKFSFADDLHGWVWNGEGDISYTLDGAQTWNTLPTDLNLAGNLADLIFRQGTGSQYIGWALSGPDETGHTRLFVTHDNGSTWTPLIP